MAPAAGRPLRPSRLLGTRPDAQNRGRPDKNVTMNDPSALQRQQTVIGSLAIVAALSSQYLGATFAKQLFELIGPAGVTSLRVALAVVLLGLLRRPRWSGLRRDQMRNLIGYGAMLGLMNLLIYQAFARIPIGIAVAIEVLGPLAVVLAGTRRALDLLWLGAALVGLVLLLPLRAATPALDPLGLACAAGAAATWALYIVYGKRVASSAGVDAVFWGMVVASVVTLPFGVIEAGSRLLAPGILLTGLAVAALSSALPYTLEMAALRRLPTQLFGVLVSASPAMAALAGWLVLGERLLPLQWLAIALIIFAVAGSTLATTGRAAPPAAVSSRRG